MHSWTDPRRTGLAASLVVALMVAGLIIPASALAAVPAAPSVPDLAAASDTGNSSTDNITMTTNGLVFSGTAEAGSTVTIYAGGVTVLGTAVATGGVYSVTTTVALPANAANSITAKATNGDGQGPASGALIVTTDNIDPAAPSAPDLTAASDTGTSSTDNYTSDTTPTFTGTAEADASVTLFAGATNVGSVVADAGGDWTITSSNLGAATYSFTAKQTDAAGNGPSPASGALSVTIDTAVPAAPSTPDLSAASDTGSSSTDNITSDTTPTFTGTAAVGTTVDLFAGATKVGTAVADGSGNWTITSSVLTAGTYSFTATATNLAGTSAASSALSVTIYTSLTVTVNQATGQGDPTGTLPINFTAVFSQAVTGFTASDVTLGGTAPGTKVVTVTGIGPSYNLAVTGLTGSGTVTASVPATSAQDLAGNNNLVSTSTDNTVTYDTTAGPTVTINQAVGQADPTGATPINFTAVFSAPVTGFDGSDVTVGGTATGTKTVTVTAVSTQIYTVAVSGMTSSGTVIATIPADRAVSVTGGHPNSASASTDNTVTYLLPAKWIVTPSNLTPVPGATITITAQLANAAGTSAPASGIVVTWSSTGGGTFSSTTSTTNANGVATVNFTVGTTIGTVYTVTATGGSVTGTSANITVTANPAVINLTSSTYVAVYRPIITLTAQFASSGANRPIQFQRMSKLDLTWTTIANATTDASGRATFTYGPPYNTQFRVSFAGAMDLSAGFSNVITVNVRELVKIAPNKVGVIKVLLAGTRVTYTATVRPLVPVGTQRVTFLIYKRVGGSWLFATSATVTASSTGKATFSWRWHRGSWYIRARGNATHYNVAGLSVIARVRAV